MKETPMCIPGIGYRVRGKIDKYEIDSMCLMVGKYSPADGTNKKNQNSILEEIQRSNKSITPPKRVFMLQENPFRFCSFIPTMQIPITTKK